MAYNKEIGMYEGWIYKISCSETPYVYIGQCSQKDVNYRWSQHKNAGLNYNIEYAPINDKPLLYYDMCVYGIDTFSFDIIEHIVDKSQNVVKNTLDKLEKEYIIIYDSFYNGYNKTKGGAGGLGHGSPCDAYDKEGNFIFSCDSVSEMSQFTGVGSMSIIDCCNGELVPRPNYIFRWRGEAFDLYRTVVNHRHNIPIYCFTSEGVFVGKYNSLSDASKDLNIYYSSIRQALERNSVTHGYYFNKRCKFDYVKAQGNCTPVDVYRYDTKEFVGSFDSIREAMITLNINKYNMSISKCLEGEHNQACGYIWRKKGHPVDEFSKVNSRVNLMKPLNVYALDDSFIGTYPSAAFVGKEFNLDKARVSMYARKTCFSGCGDYKIYFANDESQPNKSRITNMSAKEIIEKYGYVV